MNDVRNGYVTVQRARELYHVVIANDGDDFAVDETQTRDLRTERQ